MRLNIQRELKDTTPLFHTLDYFENRLGINAKMEEAVRAWLLSDGGLFSLVDFQLRQISLPELFENAIITKILRKQERQKARNQQKVCGGLGSFSCFESSILGWETIVLKKSQVEIKEAEKDREIALADADAALVSAHAQQQGEINVAKERADGQSLLIQKYGTSCEYIFEREWNEDLFVPVIPLSGPSVSWPQCATTQLPMILCHGLIFVLSGSFVYIRKCFHDQHHIGCGFCFSSEIFFLRLSIIQPLPLASLYRQFADAMGWLTDPELGYDALHYYIYSRLGVDHRTRVAVELLGFGTGYQARTVV